MNAKLPFASAAVFRAEKLRTPFSLCHQARLTLGAALVRDYVTKRLFEVISGGP